VSRETCNSEHDTKAFGVRRWLKINIYN
jgi:hypothetical protein